MPTQDREGLPVEQVALLWAARRSGVLDALLESAGTPEAVAQTTDVTPYAARVTVDALETMGFLKQVGTEYEITNRALGFLAKRDVRSIGRLPHALDLFELWSALPETMATGDTPAKPPNWTRNRLGAHAATDEAVVRACVTAAVREHRRRKRSADHSDPTHVLDLAGGSGVYAREFAARGFDVTLADDAEVVDVVTPLLEPTSVGLEATGLPSLAGFGAERRVDLVFGVDVLRRFSAQTNESLVGEAAERLAPAGTLAFVDTVRRRDDDGGEMSVRVAVDALATGGGGVHDEATVRAWFEDAGLTDVAVRDVPGTDRQVIVGHTPSGR
ncbi:Methyltransferase domain-containing protein [Halogranum rubrum]|uniref:Methyltransferase domain-containing protein n=1 Tax=Halogranum rubrum TaxID=553466 RepID=A0A1I4G059_9EURY|nr:methyltransferase domain-containing protein [Halogranum rubrum]SFL22597.1 Methyltransferase domain-containing protein [Halogranum rubrum]